MTDLFRTIVWRRLDLPGHEWGMAAGHDEGTQFYGTSIFVDEGKRCCIDYVIDCDEAGETLSVEVVGQVGEETVEIEISVGDDGVWTLNEEDISPVKGCTDIDLSFSPLTNTIAIRRLGLEVGASETVAAAWLRFPDFRLERQEQVYTRVSQDIYRYESGGGKFVREIKVDEVGIVTEYSGLWIEETG